MHLSDGWTEVSLKSKHSVESLGGNDRIVCCMTAPGPRWHTVDKVLCVYGSVGAGVYHSRFSSGSKAGWASSSLGRCTSQQSEQHLPISVLCLLCCSDTARLQVAAYPDLRKWANSEGGKAGPLYMKPAESQSLNG